MGICSMSKYYGEVPEWPKGTDCKSVGIAFGGSNPPLPIFSILDFGVIVSCGLIMTFKDVLRF